jgi:hypothetical protein
MTNAATSTPPVELIYTTPTRGRTSGRLHRVTCKHIAKGPEQLSPADAGAAALRAATLATCCSVREVDREHAVRTAEAATLEAEAAATEAAAAEAETAEAEAAAAGKVAARAPVARKAELRDMVEAFLRKHPDESFTAYRIGQKLDRSSGAVTNALVKLASRGTAELTVDEPRTYQLAAGTDAAR